MQHWNGSQMCSIDTETTGLKSHWHEIVQIAILPLDSNLEPRQDVLPFYINMIPNHPERIDRTAVKVNKLVNMSKTGHDSEKAKDLLRDWISKLGLPCTKYGTPKRLIPLGQNYTFDRGFIMAWLGLDEYNEFFSHTYADTMITATYLNDRAAMHGEKVPFSKINLAYLASTLKIPHERGHDALQDTIVTAKVYKRMLQEGVLG